MTQAGERGSTHSEHGWSGAMHEHRISPACSSCIVVPVATDPDRRMGRLAPNDHAILDGLLAELLGFDG